MHKHNKHITDAAEVVYDESPESSFTKSGENEAQKLRKKLKECEKDAKEYLDGWQRLKADVANGKKGEAERVTRAREQGVEAVLESLLPALDSFDAATQGAAWEAVEPAWRQGMEFVHSQLISALEGHGVRAFGSVGDTFDPTRHEAAEGEGERVERVLRRGYLLGERVIRPARVSIGH